MRVVVLGGGSSGEHFVGALRRLDGDSELTATDIVAMPLPPAEAAETKMETSEAINFLHRLLFDAGGTMTAKMAKEAADEAGISQKRLRTAQTKICEDSEKGGFRAGWQWQLKPEWLSREPVSPAGSTEGEKSS